MGWRKGVLSNFSYFPITGWATYANFASFPTVAPDGYPAYDLATNTLYAYDAGTLTWVAVGGGGGGTPANPTNSIQYNNAGAFGGSSTLLFNGTNTITFGTENATAILKAPLATTLNTDGGSLSLRGGGGNGTASGGDVSIEAGAAGSSGAGGDINLVAAAGAGSGGGGAFNATAGSAGLGTADGGGFSLTAGNGGATAGNGGNFVMNAGGAIGGNSDGGGVYISPGVKSGAGTQGQIHFGDPSTGFFTHFVTTGLTADHTHTFPNNDGVYALSVNGNFANSAGAITISVGSGTVTQINAGTGITLSPSPITTTGSVTANLSTGKAGGQSCIGGTAASENLTLSSTAHATKGKILLGTSAYDEVNNRLGINQATPTSRLHIVTTGLGTTQVSTSGIALENSTAAAAGAQQISPELRFKAFGWKTNATAASQSLEFRAYVLPVQGTANPTGSLKLERSINGGAYTETIRFGETGQIYCAGSAGNSGYYLRSGGATGTAIWAAFPAAPVVTSSDNSLSVSGTYDAIINVGHTNKWNIYQGNNETGHTPTINGDVWLDTNQHAMAFSIGGYSPSENSITEWPEGCIYSMYSPYVTDRTTEPNPSWWS